jgi:transposase-like protein
MKENTFFDKSRKSKISLDEIARVGAEQMLAIALTAEIEAYMESVSGIKRGDGTPVVVRNGYHRARSVAVGSGLIEAVVPRTRNRDGSDKGFKSRILPPYMRRSPKIDEVIPLLYLRGLSTGDIYPALKDLLGDQISGLSAGNISKLNAVWSKEHDLWKVRSLSDTRYCYLWVDGIHFNVRFGDNRLCVLVVIGATQEGKKELVAVGSGYRESAESWKYVLNDLKERGMCSPVLAIGDGALGFWKALPEVFPGCKKQRCWVHKTANVLDKMPKGIQGKAKGMLHDIYHADTRKESEKAFDLFIRTFEPKYSSAVDCLKKDRETLLTFFDFPAYHWKHIRSTNIIESPFSTVRLRTDKTRGQGTESTTHMMVFKLLQQASMGWQKLAGSNIIALVLEGRIFEDGELKKAA